MSEADDGERGSGRTWRQIEALPDGSIFLVHSSAMVRYCRSLLSKMGRPSKSIRFACPTSYQHLEGARPAAVAVDHAYWWYTAPGHRRAYQLILELSALHP